MSVYAIKSLNLTEKGLALLAQYPAEALQYADAILLRSTDKEEPFSYLVAIVKKYCSEKGLSTDYSLTVRLMKAYDIDPSMEPIVDKKINRIKPSTGKTASSPRPVGYDLEEVKNRIQKNNADAIEELKDTDPEKYARIKGSVETMKNVLGINDEGFTINESNPPSWSKFVDGLTYIKTGQIANKKVAQSKVSSLMKVSDQQITPELTSIPQPPLQIPEVVTWFRNIYKSKGKSYPFLAQLSSQVTDSPTPEVINALQMIKQTWPVESPYNNENQL